MRWLPNLISDLLNSPKMILVLCLIFGITGTLLDGTLYRIWELRNEQSKVQTKIVDTEKSLSQLKKRIKMANDPVFIEREAKERFDLVEEDDLIFVFSDEN
jgi:cell division protein FtsB